MNLFGPLVVNLYIGCNHPEHVLWIFKVWIETSMRHAMYVDVDSI